MHTRRALVVEDDPAICRLVEKLLTRKNVVISKPFDVDEFTKGVMGLIADAEGNA